VAVTVEVLLFASFAEALGQHRLVLQLGPGATAGDVLAEVLSRVPVAELPRRPMLAVNERYAPAERPLQAGDVVAIVPPVAGG
jgi:molybdopterin converting factor subunit 1